MRHATTIVVALVLGIAAAAGISFAGAGSAGAADVKVEGCTGSKVTLSNDEKAMLNLHNRTRAERNLPRLCVHPALQRAAEAHSRDMIRRDYFSHNTKGRKEDFAKRVKRYGYNYSTVGENIAWGSGASGSPRQIFSEGSYNWMDSPGHRKNILTRGFREVGIGAHVGTFRYRGTNYPNTTMWTVDFGDR